MTEPSIQLGTNSPAGPPGTVERARGLMLEAVLEPVLHTLGFELVHVEWSVSGRHRKLQVFIDHPDGVDLDDCARCSPILGNALDASEVADAADPAGASASGPYSGELARLLEAPYVLEVSSPGLERPLSRRSHFARYLGRLCKLRVFSPLGSGDSQRNFNGRIEAVTPDPQRPNDDRSGTVTLRDPDGGHEHQIPLDRVRRARLVYEG
ncbi:ribosome maturation factor RimP [Paraliomyxa miuraensis]|uniref:ribosome maturation factor RimP n=1 Tax=Paraliomyxa miuraensis TaxID=376150 RepID=UPI002253B6D7|nr:ribosome maturation factor RimP [Paraliomyxa miuraensis]MCX4244632.1 ribosome maturation factor RimP [Paraliomyxa miuraensis]